MVLESFDGKKIYVYEWGIENPKAVVQIVHGMTEHAARYERYARFLNGHGYAVVADDPVGEMGEGVKKLERFYKEKAGMKHVECVLFPDSRHEFLNEAADRETKWNTLLCFFDRHCG